MTRLFDRRYRLTIDSQGEPAADGKRGVEIADLDIGFQITKSTKKQPNKAEIRVYNLAPETRAKIEGKRDRLGKVDNPVRCDLEAGYVDGVSLIFSGDLHTIYTEKQGADWVTHLASADGLSAVRQANVSFGVKKGTSIKDVFKRIATGAGFKFGNLVEVTSSAQIGDMGSTFPEGTVVDGPAYDELCRLADSAGYEVSIQNGALQFKNKGEPVSEKAIELSADSGLVGSPTVEAQQEPGKTKPSDKFVKCECLLIPGIFPGRKVNIDSQDKAFNATYECIVVEYIGENFGAEWGCKLKLRPL